LYVSHRLDEVERIVDEVTILRNGRVVRASGETRINVTEIVSAMVGEDIGEHYPKERNASSEVVLEARGLAIRQASRMRRSRCTAARSSAWAACWAVAARRSHAPCLAPMI
jgi:ABC-type sugar transport system ATPase subunit